MRVHLASLCLAVQAALLHRIILNSASVKCDEKTPEERNIVDYKVDAIPLKLVPGTGYVANVEVGGQSLNLLLSPSTCGITLFESTDKICFKGGRKCYDPAESETARWCDSTMLCIPGKFNYRCDEVKSPKEVTYLT